MRVVYEFNDSMTELFDALDASAIGAATAGVYKGAGIVADAVSAGIAGIQTEPFHMVKEGEPKRKPSPEEVAVLGQGKFGIAKFSKDGASVSTVVGMGNSGYGVLKGKRKSKRVPVPVIARSIDSGTSFMQKQPFLRNALRKAQGPALAAMSAEIDARFQDIIGRHR